MAGGALGRESGSGEPAGVLRPRRVLVVSADMGEGHNATGRALEEAIGATWRIEWFRRASNPGDAFIALVSRGSLGFGIVVRAVRTLLVRQGQVCSGRCLSRAPFAARGHERPDIEPRPVAYDPSTTGRYVDAVRGRRWVDLARVARDRHADRAVRVCQVCQVAAAGGRPCHT